MSARPVLAVAERVECSISDASASLARLSSEALTRRAMARAAR